MEKQGEAKKRIDGIAEQWKGEARNGQAWLWISKARQTDEWQCTAKAPNAIWEGVAI